MKRLLAGALFAFFALPHPACAGVWSRAIAEEVVNNLVKIESYEGTTVEEHLVEGEVVRRHIVYAKPWRVRVETLAPASHAGELFIYDGDQVLMWWPKHLFGMRIRGFENPSNLELRRHVERLTRRSLEAYAFSLEGEEAVASQRTKKWRVMPTQKGDHRYVHRVWNHHRYTMPLKMTFKDGEGEPWYSMAFEEITFDTKVDDSAFTHQFPKNAVIFDWDLAAPGRPLEELREEMNFTIKEPKKLPAGHAMRKAVRSEHCLPLLAMVINNGSTVLTLTQSRHLGQLYQPLGKPIAVGEYQGHLSFLGAFSSVTWVQDGTLLTLTSNLAFPELLAVAESVE